MKPTQLPEALQAIGELKTLTSEAAETARVAMTAERRADIRLSLAKLSAIADQKLVHIEAGGTLTPEQLAVRYAWDLVRRLTPTGHEDVTAPIVISNTALDHGFSHGQVLAHFMAHRSIYLSDRQSPAIDDDGLALSSGTLVVYYQPKYPVENELVSPWQFQETAHQRKLLGAMALQDARPDTSLPLLDVQNISGADTSRPVASSDFVDWAKFMLQRALDPANALELYSLENLLAAGYKVEASLPS